MIELARLLQRGHPDGVIERRLLAAVLMRAIHLKAKRGRPPNIGIAVRNPYLQRKFADARTRGAGATDTIASLVDQLGLEEEHVAKVVYRKK